MLGKAKAKHKGVMIMKLVKKGLLCLICSAVAAVLWLIIANLIYLEMDNVGFTTFVVFVAMSVAMSAVNAREYFNKNNSVFKKIGSLALMSIFSLAVMYGVFYLAIFTLLLFGH